MEQPGISTEPPSTQTQRLVICQILKLYLKELFKRNTDASFREMKELSPIKNKIERMEKEMNKKHSS